jgi:hypothetical protein
VFDEGSFDALATPVQGAEQNPDYHAWRSGQRRRGGGVMLIDRFLVAHELADGTVTASDYQLRMDSPYVVYPVAPWRSRQRPRGIFAGGLVCLSRLQAAFAMVCSMRPFANGDLRNVFFA